MADNTQMGSTADLIATDDIGGGVKVARNKVGFGADGSYQDVSLANPLPVTMESTGGGAVASELHLGEVGGSTTTVSVTPVIAAGAYAANRTIGGILTLAGAMRVVGGKGVLQSALVIDLAHTGTTLEILLFSQAPVNGAYADGTAFALHPSDVPFLIRRVPVTAADWLLIGTNPGVADLDGISKAVQAAGSADLFAVAVVTGTPTFASTSDLTFRFGFLRD